MISQQYDDDFISKFCNVADVQKKSTLNGVFIEDVDAFMYHSIRNYFENNSRLT